MMKVISSFDDPWLTWVRSQMPSFNADTHDLYLPLSFKTLCADIYVPRWVHFSGFVTAPSAVRRLAKDNFVPEP